MRTQLMMTNQGRKRDWLFQKKASLVMLAAMIVLPAFQRAEAAASVVLWDTGSRLAGAADVESRAGWKPVPSELFIMEADPSKAASDPGYYGREYSFRGDAIVENRSLVAAFFSSKGRVVIYSKDGAPQSGSGARHDSWLGSKFLECVPLQSKTQPTHISRFGILRNADDEVALEVAFSVAGASDACAIFAFDRTEVVAIKSAENMKGISLEGQIQYGVAPGFIGDDLIYGAAEYPSASAVRV